MKISEVIGIDVSKLVIDIRIHSNQMYCQLENSKKCFKKMVKWCSKNSPYSDDEIIYVFEHTGLYSHNLAVYLTDQKIPFHMVPGLEIKRSLGIARGKDDKVDATKIARYGYRLKEEIHPFIMPCQEIDSLKRLLSLRERLVKHRSGFKVSYKEQKRVLVQKENKTLFEVQQQMIKYLSKQIEKVEKEMDSIVQSDERLKSQYDLITGITSIGPQTALFIIAFTAGFTKFKNSRKFAAYCGIAPFPNTSGTSLKGSPKVSHLANKKIKSLLDQCAKNAIRHNIEMKLYYEKRVDNGKQKMSTINIIRNKLLARIFAVVSRNTPYVNIMKYAA
jgi:transposase